MKIHNNRERRKWQNPDTILVDVGLKPGFTFIDVGCGNGFFTLPASKIVGEKGRVYGIDVNVNAIENLKKKAKRENLKNLTLIAEEAEETIPCDTCADIVFFGIVLHDFRDPGRVLSNAKKILKPTGRLVNLDWQKKSMEVGPPLRIRFSQEEAVHLIKSAGFKIHSIKSGRYHYIVIAKPK